MTDASTTVPRAPDPACHETVWSAKRIDGIWCVGMTGNLDTVHDATLRITGGWLSDAEAGAIAQSVADLHNQRAKEPAPAPNIPANMVAEEKAAIFELLDCADQMPKATPAPGHSATEHQFTIEAGIIWSLDRAVQRVRKALAAARKQAGHQGTDG